MGVADREYVRQTEAEPSPTWLRRLNAFGERHSKLILFLSTALIIITVLIVADAMWKRARVERGLRELDAAAAPDQLEALRKNYGDSDVLLPRILYKLGNRYQEDRKLKEADEIYAEFLARFPNDPLQQEVLKARTTLEQNRLFAETEQEGFLKFGTLETHPVRTSGNADSPVRFGPVPSPRPVATLALKTSRAQVEIELLPDEAPKAVEHFLTLCDQKYFDGLGFRELSGDKKRLEVDAKSAVPPPAAIPLEPSGRDPEAGVVAMLRSESGTGNRGAEFLILLSDDPTLVGHTIFGRVREGGLPYLHTAAAQKDSIDSLRRKPESVPGTGPSTP